MATQINQDNQPELSPEQRKHQARENLEKLEIWLNDPFTKDFLSQLKRHALETLVTTTRAPKNIWDLIQREQDKGEAKGLLTFEDMLDRAKAELTAIVQGKPWEKPETSKIAEILQGLESVPTPSFL